MALNITEAHDVNTLLDWILGIRRPSSTKTDDELAAEAQAAAGRLADKANKTLMAGLDLSRVNEAWVRVEACPWQETPMKPCPDCEGRGWYFELGGDPCPKCQTTGKVPDNG